MVRIGGVQLIILKRNYIGFCNRTVFNRYRIEGAVMGKPETKKSMLHDTTAIGSENETPTSGKAPEEVVNHFNELKPPIGIIPKNIFERNTKVNRRYDLQSAIYRYLHKGLKINLEWVEEYNDLTDQLF